MNNPHIKLFVGGHNSAVPLIKATDVSYRNYLAKAGFLITPNPADADAAVFIEMDKKQLSKLKINVPIILIRNEPIVVWPDNYKKRILRKVDKTIDVGQFKSDSNSFVPWPQDWTQIIDNDSANFDRKNRIALVNGNKIGFIRGENYALRRRCIHKVEELDLFGVGWRISNFRKFIILTAELVIALKNGFIPKLSSAKLWFRRPRNYLGKPLSKYQVLTNYKYSLVIENSNEYMSEKLFDALIAENIPIYVGPDVRLFGIPDGLVVQVEPNFNSIVKGIDFAKSIDYDIWKIHLNTWIKSPSTKEIWDMENVYVGIVKDIVDFLDLNLTDS